MAAEPSELSDEVLVQRVVARDVAAFELLYRKYHGRLVRLVTRMTRRGEVADEIANEAMLVLWQGAAGFRGAARVSTWLSGIAYRLALKRLARERRDLDTVTDDEAAEIDPRSPEDVVAEAQSHRRLRAAIRALPPNQQAVVELTLFHGCSYAEIALLLECPVGTVKTRMFHARARLRHAVETAAPRRQQDLAS